MNLIDLQKLILAQAPPATGTQLQDDPKSAFLKMIGPFVLMFVALYFIILRPQNKKAKEHAKLLKTVKPGDRVLTNGGILGVVVTVKDQTLAVRSMDTKFEILKSAVTEITERAGDAAATES